MMPTMSVSPAAYSDASTSLHRALVMEAVLVVFDDRFDRLEHDLAVRILDGVLQIEILNRDVVVAELEGAAHRLEVGLFHRLAQRLLVGNAALGAVQGRVDQEGGVVALRAIERGTRAVVLLDVV